MPQSLRRAMHPMAAETVRGAKAERQGWRRPKSRRGSTGARPWSSPSSHMKGPLPEAPNLAPNHRHYPLHPRRHHRNMVVRAQGPAALPADSASPSRCSWPVPPQAARAVPLCSMLIWSSYSPIRPAGRPQTEALLWNGAAVRQEWGEAPSENSRLPRPAVIGASGERCARAKPVVRLERQKFKESR